MKKISRLVSMKTLLRIFIFIGVAQLMFIMIFFTPPSTITSYLKMNFTEDSYRDTPFYTVKHQMNCAKFFINDFSDTANQTFTRPLKSTVYSWTLFGNCSQLFKTHYYPRYPLSRMEADFPLAYILLVNEHLEQIEILLNAIYAPQNVYCIHVCAKSSYYFHQAIERLSSCFHNVFITSTRVPISRTGINMLHAQRSCLHELYYRQLHIVPWKYVITLQGHDFPLRTNAELVKVLQTLDGANDIELLIPSNDRYSNVFVPVRDMDGFENYKTETNRTKTAPPHNLTLYKGSFSCVLNKQIIQFALENQTALDLLDWLNDTYMPDEFFWSTLNHNEFLQMPGGYPGHCYQSPNKTKSWVSRFAVWDTYKNSNCSGIWRNTACVFNCGDLPMLSGRSELFLNKLWIESYSVALDCMHELIFNRTYRKDQTYPPGYNFDENYYQTQSVVVYQKWRKDNPDKDTSLFPCVSCSECLH